MLASIVMLLSEQISLAGLCVGNRVMHILCANVNSIPVTQGFCKWLKCFSVLCCASLRLTTGSYPSCCLALLRLNLRDVVTILMRDVEKSEA